MQLTQRQASDDACGLTTRRPARSKPRNVDAGGLRLPERCTIKLCMRTQPRVIAALELMLIFPAALFMTALVVRRLRPLQYEPAHTAQRIVMWYSGQMWTLWVLLLALPCAVLVTGCATLLRGWNRDAELRNPAPLSPFAIRAHPATLFIAATTLAAAGILAIVVLHMAAN